MAEIIISNFAPFGSLTNQTTAKLINLNSQVPRLAEAIATASSGYAGVPGTQFESPIPGANAPLPNNFGVTPDPASPGQKGQDYAYAVGVLSQAWENFWLSAKSAIDQLDNGTAAL